MNLGLLKWEVQDRATGSRIAGEKSLGPGDIEVVEHKVVARDLNARYEGLKHLFETLPPEDPRIPEIKDHLAKATSYSDPNEVVETWYSKGIELDDVFVLSYAEHPGKATEGFGFSLKRSDIHTFGWDWFQVMEPGLAVKLQEKGRLRFEVGRTPNGREIVWMKFETDVSMRTTRFEKGAALDADWRVNVLAGSEIRWPSFGDEVNPTD